MPIALTSGAHLIAQPNQAAQAQSQARNKSRMFAALAARSVGSTKFRYPILRAPIASTPSPSLMMFVNVPSSLENQESDRQIPSGAD
jgi:hypothetical protein